MYALQTFLLSNLAELNKAGNTHALKFTARSHPSYEILLNQNSFK